MPWLNNKSEKANLEDLVPGLTAEQLKQQLADGAEAKAELAKVNTTLAGVAETLARIEAKPAPNTTPIKKEDENIDVPSILDDEDAAFNHRLKPVMAATLVTRAHQVYSDVKSTIIESQNKKNGYNDFSLFEEEIKAELEKSPVQYRCNPTFVQNTYDMVRGRHAEDIRRDADKKEGKYYIESSTNNGNTVRNNGDKDDKKTKLSDDELMYMKKFGMTEDEYIKSKGLLKYV